MRHPLPFLLPPALLFAAFSSAQTVIDVTDYGAAPDSGADATVPFQQAIAAAKAVGGPVTLNIPAGRYDFFSTDATRRACYFSNATESGSDAVRTIALDFTDLDGLTVEGHGARLVMRGKMTMLVAERCADLTLRDLEFDFARPTVSEIEAIEKHPTYWIGKVHPDSTFRIVGGNRIEWFGEDWADFHNMCQPYDPGTDKVWRGADPTAGVTAITDLGGGQLRFDAPADTLARVSVGWIYQFRNTRRDETGMWFNRCQTVRVEDVKVRFMHGFGMLFQFTDGVDIERLEIAPPPGSGRTCASGADVLHFSGCRGTVRIADSKLSAANDDALNAHGTHLRIVETPAPNKIRVRFMQSLSWGFQAFVPGDAIEFVHKNTLLSFGEAVVGAVEMTSDPREQILTLDRDAPSGLVLGSDVVENVTWTPAVQLINCDISRIPTRGILLTTRRPILVQGNRFFRTIMPAILVEDDAASWFESGPVHDLTITGNSFFECGESVVRINPENSTYAGPVHRNIRIDDNVFTLEGNGAVSAKSTDGLVVSGNRFRMRNETTPPAADLVSTTHTTGLLIEDNTVEAASTPALSVANGDFEQEPVGGTSDPGAAEWFSDPLAGVRTLAGAPGADGQLVELDAGACVYQRLGATDPVQADHLHWSLRQIAADGSSAGLKVSFHVWDGRFAPADDTDIAEIPAFSSTQLPALSPGDEAVERSAYLDLSGLPAGSFVWMRIEATGGTARVDSVSATPATPPDTSRYAGWAESFGLAGEDADPYADPDHDGMANLLEFTIEGANPLSPDPTPMQAAPMPGSGNPAFWFHPRPTSDVTLIAEYQIGALDPAGWQTVVDGVDGLAVHDDADGTRWIEAVDASMQRLFIRLVASFVPTPPPVVENPSFEDPALSNGDYSSGNPAGWTFSSSVNWGVEHVGDDRFGANNPLPAPGEGVNVGYINLGTSGTASATSADLGVVAPDTVYTLTIAFGQRASGDRHPDGSFGLLVNGNPVGAFTPVESQSLPTGFTDLTFTWTSPGFGDPLIGQTLRIRMNFSYSSALGGWQQAQFDNVRLETRQAP